MNDRGLKLDGYGISRELYQEMRGFCLQYSEKKKKLQKDIPPALREKFIADIKVIEEAAVECVEGNDHITPCILEAATNPKYRFAIKRELFETSCAEGTFLKCRRRFYWTLARKKGLI